MPVRMELTENNRIMRYTFTDPWETHDILILFGEDQAYRDASSVRIHTILDIRETQRVPSGAMRAYLSPSFQHANRGYLAVIGGSTLYKSLFGTIFRLAKFHNHRFFDNEIDGLTYLYREIAHELHVASLLED